MRVIFLDFDGVINSAKSFSKLTKKNNIHKSRRELDQVLNVSQSLCPEATANLQGLLEQLPDVKIVISSTWRRIFELDWLREKLNSYGVDGSRVIDRTPGDDAGPRGLEIREWLNAHTEVTDYVIFDDNRLGFDMTNGELDKSCGHGSRFIQTTWNDGLLKRHVKKALEVFGVKKTEA